MNQSMKPGFLRWGLSIVLAAVLAGSMAYAAPDTRGQVATGLTALHAGEYRKAIPLLSQGIDANALPDNQVYLLYAARGYAQAAEEWWKKAAETYGLRAELTALLARL